MNVSDTSVRVEAAFNADWRRAIGIIRRLCNNAHIVDVWAGIGVVRPRPGDTDHRVQRS